MPIPFILIGIAAATGAFGIGKTIKAGADQKEANETNKEANITIRNATNKINRYRKNCGVAIENLGMCKIKILDGSIKPFIIEFEKLNNVEFTRSKGLEELKNIVLDKNGFGNLKKMQSMASSMLGGLVSGTMTGAITAFGAYGAAGVLATASTGTAISSLSGVAATNATLAFFGGGSLAAGGLGMAGGTAILGGLVAGPALAVMGAVIGAKASANKDKAYSNLIKAEKYREEMDAAALLCDGIIKKANSFNEFLLSLNSVFEPLIFEMSNIIKNKGTNFENFSEKEKKVVAKAMAIAGAIKAIIDTPILDKNGKITAESTKVIEKVNSQCLLNKVYD